MKRSGWILGLVLWAATCSAQAPTISGLTVNTGSGCTPACTANQAQFTWSTGSVSSDSTVAVSPSSPGSDVPTMSRWIYDATPQTTNHSIMVDYLIGGTSNVYYQVSSCTHYPNCAITDSGYTAVTSGASCYPTRPAQTGCHFAFPAVPAGTLTWTLYPWTGAKRVYQGTTLDVTFSAIISQGAASQAATWKTTAISVDGTNCTSYTSLGCSTVAGISVVFICEGTESVNGATNNYIVPGVPSSNNYFYCYNPSFNYTAGTFHIITTGSASIGSHTLSATVQADDGTGSPVGSAQSFTYAFSVIAPATFTPVSPASYPAITALGTWVGAITSNSTTKCTNLTNQQAAGYWNNYTMTNTQSSLDPMEFDWGQSWKQLADYFGAISATFNSGTTYKVGDGVKNGSYTYIVTAITTGTGGTAPVGTTIGASETSAGTTWWNVGNTAYWYACDQKYSQQLLNYAVTAPHYTSIWEYAQYTWGFLMDWSRQNDTLAENCNGSGTCVGLNATAIDNFSSLTLNNVARTAYYGYSIATIRAMPYGMQSFLAEWVKTGGTSVPEEVRKRLDAMIQQVDLIVNYNPQATPFACCLSSTFYMIPGLLADALVHTYVVESTMGATPDPRIPGEVLRLIDWSHKYWNMTGSDYLFSVYAPWELEVDLAAGFTDLNAPSYAWPIWLWRVYGDTCSLPTSSTPCKDFGDLIFQKAIVNPQWGNYIQYKQYTDMVKWFANYVHWRDGTLSAADSWVLPSHNAYIGSVVADSIGPMPIGWSVTGFTTCIPHASSVSPTSATITWCTWEATTSTIVKVSDVEANIHLDSGTTCGASTFIGNNNQWSNTCLVTTYNSGTALASGHKYYIAVGGTDAAGNTALSPSGLIYDAQPAYTLTSLGFTPYSFTTTTPIYYFPFHD